MHQYGIRDVERLLRLPRSTIRALIAAGFVAPERGPRNSWRFSFQDLIVLRTARTLVAADVPHRRITRALKELRRRLPDEMPLSGLSISAIGEHVVVREGGSRWQAESGQYLLAFEGDPAGGAMNVIEPAAARATPDAEHWFDRAAELERNDRNAALHAYRQAIAADPARLDARINLGRLLHETGRHAEAERVYMDALKDCGADALLLFNFGVLLGDMQRIPQAVKAYQAALRVDPGMADCHYNLALLCEEVGLPKDAIRHMAQYRKLAGARSR
jgi:tetratricopeptide (TPR) repeat protein